MKKSLVPSKSRVNVFENEITVLYLFRRIRAVCVNFKKEYAKSASINMDDHSVHNKLDISCVIYQLINSCYKLNLNTPKNIW